MAAFKNEINNIFAQNSEITASTKMFARALNTIISTSLKGGAGFLLEMIQNAEDAGATSISIKIKNGVLLFSHNGKPFSTNDIREVCNFGHDQDKSKQEDNEKIGYKGIGFKSVFSVSDQVYVITKNGTFRFDKSHHEQKDIPWQVCPIFTEPKDLAQNVPVANIDQQFETTVALQLKDGLNLQSQMQQLANNPEALMFLHNVNNISISTGYHNTTITAHSIVQAKNIRKVRLDKNGTIDSQWVVFDSTIELGHQIKKELQDPNTDDSEYPPRLRALTKTSVQYACRLDQNDRLTPTKGRIFCGLPTEVQTQSLPMLVNVPNIVLEASRKQILENNWNKYLVSQIVGNLGVWMQTLSQDPQYRDDVLSLLPMPRCSELPTSLQSNYTNAVIKLEDINCIRTANHAVKSLKHTRIDSDGFYLAFGDLAVELVNLHLVHPNIKHTDRFIQFHQANHDQSGQQIFFKDLFNKLPQIFEIDTSPLFQQRLWRFIIQYLDKNPKEKTSIKKHLKVLGVNNSLYPLNGNVYLPSNDMHAFTALTDYNIVHPMLYHNAPNIEQMLMSLDVQTITPNAIIHDYLVPALVSNSQPNYNVAMLTYVLQHRKSLLHEDIKKLANAHVKTTKGEYIPVGLSYLSDLYQPELCLEKDAPNARCFISPEYLTAKTLLWKAFFLELGAAQNFNVKKVTCQISQLDIVSGHPDISSSFTTSISANSNQNVSAYVIPLIQLITQAKYQKMIWEIVSQYELNSRSSSVHDVVQFFLTNMPVCLASDNEHYPGKTSLSAGNSPLIQSVLVHITLPIKLNSRLERYLSLRTEPTAKQWFDILDALNTKNSRHTKDYAQVLNALYAIRESRETQELAKRWNGKLLAEDGTLRPINTLLSFQSNHFTLRPSQYWLNRLDTTGTNYSLSSYQQRAVADLFNIRKIDNWSYKLDAPEAKEDTVVQQRITDKRAIGVLAFLENQGREGVDHQKVVDDYHTTLSHLTLNVAKTMTIQHKDDKKEVVLQKADLVTAWQTITYAGGVDDMYVAQGLTAYLKNQLHLNNPHIDRVLHLFFTLDYQAFTQKLEDYYGYNLRGVPAISEEIKEPKKSAQSDSPEIFIGIPAGRFRPLNNSNNAPSFQYSTRQEKKEGVSKEEKAERLHFVSCGELPAKCVLIEADLLDFDDLTRKIDSFIFLETNRYRTAKSSRWSKGVVFRHLIEKYIAKFSDMKMAECKSAERIRFISSDQRTMIDVEMKLHKPGLFKNKKEGDIHVTKYTFDKKGALTSKKINKMVVDSPKESELKKKNHPEAQLRWTTHKKTAASAKAKPSSHLAPENNIIEKNTVVEVRI